MAPLPIHFFTEDISFILKQKALVRNWINGTILNEGAKLKELNFIFCSDEYLLTINRQYLNHSTLTDIITFDNSDEKGVITGDIFISIDRVSENAVKYKVPHREELHRVIIHGTLHLLGYTDKTKALKAVMTKKEDEYLNKRPFI